jgi:DNA repair exonuclease SbcCD nuclease subunit
VSSDWHADHISSGVDRLDDVKAATMQIVQHAIGKPPHTDKADLFLFLGDLCDPDDSVRALQAVWLAFDVAVQLSDNGIPARWLSGNHDCVETNAGITTLHGLRHGTSQVFEKPALELHWGCNIVALPFTASSHPYDPAKHVRDCVERIDKAGRWNLPTLVLSHLHVPGVIPGEETKELARGREVLLPHEEIGKMLGRGSGRVLILQGHFHRPQRVVLSGVEILIAGSVARLTHSEEEHEVSFISMEV